jgi:hypothetical protein
MADLRNEFSWSFTRHKTWVECRRQYYWNYYGYWNGWSDNAPDEARLAYRLKKMQSLPMWLGDLVHRMIERILGDLRNRELNRIDRYQEQARDIMNRQWLQSVERKWMWKPKYNLNLFEHYYGLEVTKEDRLAARDKVFACLAHFFDSPIFEALSALPPGGWKSLEVLEKFPVGDLPVFVKIDCATQDDSLLRIYDWKTGKATEDTQTQLACYALFARQVWNIPLERQRLVSFYLEPSEIRELAPTVESLIETKDFILRSMEEMTGTLDGPIGENRLSIDACPMTDRKFRCRRCFFREICFCSREWSDIDTATA